MLYERFARQPPHSSDPKSLGLVFVMIGSLDRPEGIEPKLEMFTKRRLGWTKALDILQFPGMPS
jgi:hypothetical protein